MNSIISKIDAINWENTAIELHKYGYTTISGFLSEARCDKLISLYDVAEGYRKKEIMERYHFGVGEYKYFDYPLHDMRL